MSIIDFENHSGPAVGSSYQLKIVVWLEAVLDIYIHDVSQYKEPSKVLKMLYA